MINRDLLTPSDFHRLEKPLETLANTGFQKIGLDAVTV